MTSRLCLSFFLPHQGRRPETPPVTPQLCPSPPKPCSQRPCSPSGGHSGHLIPTCRSGGGSCSCHCTCLPVRTRGPLSQAHRDARTRGPLIQAHLDARARGPLIQADLDARTRGPLIQAHLDVRTRGPLPGLSLCPRMLFFQACPTRAPGSSTITCKILSPVKLTVPSSLSPSPCVHHQPPGRLVGCVRLPALSGLQTLGEQNCLFLMP